MKRGIWFGLMSVGLLGAAAASEGNALSLDPGVQLNGVWLDAGAARSRGLVVTECISRLRWGPTLWTENVDK